MEVNFLSFESKTMNLHVSGGVNYLTFKTIDTEKFSFLRHAFSTRIGGISTGEYSSMNLGFSTGDLAKNVFRNFEIFCHNVGLDKTMLVIPEQTHSKNVKIVDMSDTVGDELISKRVKNTDGLITNVPGVVLTTFHADCNSLFFVDPATKTIGLAHAGWRGTVAKIAEVMVNSFVQNFGSRPENIICLMGPAIQECCFEVRDDVLPMFNNMNLPNVQSFIRKSSHKTDAYKIDLFGINRQILLSLGILEKNIAMSDLCTKCNPNLFYSHRISGKKRGTMAAFMCLF